MRWRQYDGSRFWHRWFAWHPVRLQGTNIYVWLEYVERQMINYEGWLLSDYRELRDK